METKAGSRLVAGLVNAAPLGRASARPSPQHEAPPPPPPQEKMPSASGTSRFSVARAERPAAQLGFCLPAQGEAVGRK